MQKDDQVTNCVPNKYTFIACSGRALVHDDPPHFTALLLHHHGWHFYCNIIIIYQATQNSIIKIRCVQELHPSFIFSCCSFFVYMVNKCNLVWNLDMANWTAEWKNKWLQWTKQKITCCINYSTVLVEFLLLHHPPPFTCRLSSASSNQPPTH